MDWTNAAAGVTTSLPAKIAGSIVLPLLAGDRKGAGSVCFHAGKPPQWIRRPMGDMMVTALDADRPGVGKTSPREKALHRLVVRFPPHIVFLLIGGTNAILLCVLTPPFQVHDEFQHFFRGYQLSEAVVWGSVRDGRPGGVLPSSLPVLVERTWGTLKVWHIPPLGIHPLAGTWSEFRQPLAPRQLGFAEFLTASYSPLLYLPQAVGIALGRVFGASPLALLYLGRLATAATAVAVIAWSLRVLPLGRATALAVALLPMAQFEYGSVAPDGLIIAAAFLVTALTLRAGQRRAWPKADLPMSAFAAAILCCKLVYAPLLAIGVPSMLRMDGTGTPWRAAKHLLWTNLLIAGIALGLAGLWLASTSSTLAAVLLPPATVAAKTAAILDHPLRYAGILVADFRAHGWDYMVDAIGILGARTVYLSRPVYLLAALSLVLSGMLADNDDPKLPAAAIAYNACLIIGTCVLIQTAMFVMGTPVGASTITGVQGRYFLPLGALAATTLVSVTGMPRCRTCQALGYPLLLLVVCFDTWSMDMTIVDKFHLL